jgi:arylsulfatase A-like enzyme
LAPAQRQYLISAYDASIAYVDQQMDRVWAEMKRLGVFEDSLIIVTSDHGELFGGYSVLGHGAGTFSELVHVPLFVKYPRGTRPPCDQCTVSGVDILPTITDVLGVAAPAGLDGRSLLRPGAETETPAIAESFEDQWYVRRNLRYKGEERAAFLADHVLRLSRRGEIDSGHWVENRTGSAAATDPLALDHLLSRFEDLARLDRRRGGRAEDREIQERLKALGYIDD